jgi:hypothetical protein
MLKDHQKDSRQKLQTQSNRIHTQNTSWKRSCELLFCFKNRSTAWFNRLIIWEMTGDGGGYKPISGTHKSNVSKIFQSDMSQPSFITSERG